MRALTWLVDFCEFVHQVVAGGGRRDQQQQQQRRRNALTTHVT